ncbi:MAG: glycogen/starch/alpha-glucan phosphorylase [Deltaproteobacteria bacterium]|jgi:glycogen phosphorylase|nr:glycogen/starch/alpha-glucan phosphorylase [Deltaproteobacteria bacterium]MBT4527581.1 glycogen/starch/alpha-glucan phosphorylase [Deltaproteobacteria bacterium]
MQTNDKEKAIVTDQLRALFLEHMKKTVAHDFENSSRLDKYRSLAHTVRDKIIEKWLKSQEIFYDTNPKRVYYFSLEFLMGRTMVNALINLDISKEMKVVLEEMGITLEELEEMEWDAGLGNGGLGRLAACFLDSMATLGLPAYGFGIRYEYGMFRQAIVDKQQQEYPDNWLRYENPWEYPRAQGIQIINFYGKTHSYTDHLGKVHNQWVDTEQVIAMPYDVPIPGYKTENTISLKLWSAKSSRDFNLKSFNAGDYIGAIIDKHQSEVISKVLYPNDNSYVGKELRLKQQYFMVAASIQDILYRHKRCGDSIDNIHEKIVIQLNDTHPSIAIPELMRILMDIHDFDWDKAWYITTNTFAYTNHTVLPEALEKWPLSLINEILPRHLEIIFEINHRFLDFVSSRFPGDFDRRKRMSIIEEGDAQNIRMAYLAIIGSFSVNGVAALHSNLLKTGIFKDFYEVYPEKFNNKTNGVTPRRWLKKANEPLSDLISDNIGDSWVKDFENLKELEQFTEKSTFVSDWQSVKNLNKKRFAGIIERDCGVEINNLSMFDVQVKRIHEYKRQLLNILHIITLYNRIKSGEYNDIPPRTVIFGGKAAPGYERAKEIIHLINSIAHLINNDPSINNLLKVVFLPNYGVSLAEKIFPGSDLSEQISTAGMEASGTGNMKFAINGALTIGTLDGANVEMQEEVGEENIFIFGYTDTELIDLRNNGYFPHDIYQNDLELKRVLDQIFEGYFSPDSKSMFHGIFNNLVHEGDFYFHLADYRSYIECQEKVSNLYQDPLNWAKKSILNVARMSKFSSDRTIKQYAEEIWNVKPCID